MAITQASFRGRNDDGTQTTATWKAAANVSWNQQYDQNFRVRFLITTNASTTTDWQAFYQKNAGSWTAITGSSSVCRSFSSANVSDGTATTQQLGAGTFVASVVDTADGFFPSIAVNTAQTELELCVQLRSADLVPGDVVGIRIQQGNFTAFGTYTATPQITVTGPPIQSTDIKHYLSVTSGSAGFTTAGTPGTSLGKYISTTEITDATLSNLFDLLSGTDNASGKTDYRCRFVLNNHATLTLYNAVAYIGQQNAGGADVSIASDNIAPSAKGSSSAQAAQIASTTTTPTGIGTFSQPTTVATGISLGDIGPGQVKAIWEKRILTASTAATNSDGLILVIHGDTQVNDGT